jgi:hypothetical protein
MGFVRVFMAPKNDERNQPMNIKDQRLFMIELDKFIVQLRPGDNVVRRKSVDSTVTIPFERIFRPLDENPNADDEQFNFCNCGWPHYLLIPKGLPEGEFIIFNIWRANFRRAHIFQGWHPRSSSW